jgi:hypothetical protein
MVMTERMQDALNIPMWHEETDKCGYRGFLENLVHDNLWNTKNTLNKYAKAHQPGDAGLQDAIARSDLLAKRLQQFTKSHNQARSIAWWRSTAGMVEVASQMRHLVALPSTARVIPMDDIRRRGGYATIRRVHLEGVPEVQSWWEFAAKQSNQIDRRPDLAKMEHQNESMAMTIPHPCVIKFAAIHAEIYEGYAYWWKVELYETCLIWMVDTATTSLHALCMTIYQAKNFFMPNSCVGFGRSEQN